MEDEIKTELQRGTCTGRIVRTEEALIVIENSGVLNEGL